MESVPTLRPTSALGSLVSLGTLALFCLTGALLAPRAELGIIGGAAVFLVYRLLVRELLCRHHRQGVRLTREGKFREGLMAFKASEAFWSRHPVLDRYRWLLLGSSGPYTFLSLARYNQAFCLSRLNRVAEAVAMLKRVLAENPGMAPALELRDALKRSLATSDGEIDGAERTWSDQNPAESTWVFEDPHHKAEDRD